jgi:ATP-dependent helicase/nuclease subunit A
MPEITEQQRKAIAANTSVALAAGAGCGKTFVLTERFLACLDPQRRGGPMRLDQLTAITFTERAAREMRERIRRACLERLKSASEEHVGHWLRTLRDIDSARISTIHSFCGTLLRTHAVEARLDPHFQVLEATAAKTVLFELIDEQLRNRLVEGDEKVMDLVVKFGLDGLREMAERLLDERQEIDWEYWLGETPGGLLARWEDFWKTSAIPRVLKTVGKSHEAAALLDILSRETPSHAVMRERCELLRDRLPRLTDAADPAAALEEIRAAAMVIGGGGKSSWSSEEVFEEFKNAAKSLREDVIDKVKKQLSFDLEKAVPAAEAALALLNVAHGLAAAYDRRKREVAALDFDDLLIEARKLLVGPDREDLRQRLAAQSKLLLVDEFQDTDPLQVELVRALCDDCVADGKLFFVGDYKQSIYRFRGADPHVFRRLREEIPAEGQLPLTRNFRSQPAVIDFVNSLFAGEMGSRYEPLDAHRLQLGPSPAVEFLWAIDPDGEQSDTDPEHQDKGVESGEPRPSQAQERVTPDDYGESDIEGSRAERNRRREARWIARRLRAMLDCGDQIIWDKVASGEPALRAVRPGDITLLFRALTNVEYYEEALRNHNIDYYLVGGHAFYAQQEIFDIVNLLRAVASPCDEVSLVGILRSPMFGILDETLFHLSKHKDGLSGGFWSVLDSLESDGSPSLFKAKDVADDSASRVSKTGRKPLHSKDELARVRFAAETLAELHAEKDRMPIAQLIHKALERTGYDAMLLAEFLGERKLANLHKLIEQARQFDAAGIFTLADFITQLAQFVARQPDEPLAATQPESINAVRLMSIHQSKGLEFPVVVVVDVDRPRRTIGERIAFTRELGPMVRMPECMSGYDLFQQAEREEDLAELTRLLYVAATRAGDYLILSSGMDDLDKPQGPWTELLRRHFDLGAGTLLRDPSRKMVKVTCEEPVLPRKASPVAKSHDLIKTVAKAQKLAAAGKGDVPDQSRPIAVDYGARRHYSVSRLQGTITSHTAVLASGEDDASYPAATLDPLGFGTLVHAVLADLAVGKDDSRAAIESLARKHAILHLPTAGNEIAEATDLIANLTQTPRWASIRGASRTYSELEFLIAWPPDGADLGLNGNLPRDTFIQGFIDCLYLDAAGDWRLMDYKTNRISPQTISATVASYEMQMLVYALAAEHVLKRPPAEIFLHFLRGNIEHQFAWNEAARRRAVEMVSAGLGAAIEPGS